MPVTSSEGLAFPDRKGRKRTVCTRNIVDSNITSFLSKLDTYQFPESSVTWMSALICWQKSACRYSITKKSFPELRRGLVELGFDIKRIGRCRRGVNITVIHLSLELSCLWVWKAFLIFFFELKSNIWVCYLKIEKNKAISSWAKMRYWLGDWGLKWLTD